MIDVYKRQGYIRDPKYHNHLIIDDYAAKVVQLIYDLYICGYGKAKIGSILSSEGLSLIHISYDFDSEEDNAVTVRDRDTMQQERVKIEDLKAYFEDKFRF